MERWPWQPTVLDGTASSPLKDAIVAFFNLAKCGAKLRTEAQNNDLRRYFVIASVRGEYAVWACVFLGPTGTLVFSISLVASWLCPFYARYFRAR